MQPTVTDGLSEEFLLSFGRERREQILWWLTEYFGRRCDEYEPTCIVCQKWKAFDEIFEDL